jgi:hypothetical protein
MYATATRPRGAAQAADFDPAMGGGSTVSDVSSGASLLAAAGAMRSRALGSIAPATWAMPWSGSLAAGLVAAAVLLVYLDRRILVR